MKHSTTKNIYIYIYILELILEQIINHVSKDIAENENQKGRYKYMDIKYKYVQVEIMKNEIELNTHWF